MGTIGAFFGCLLLLATFGLQPTDACWFSRSSNTAGSLAAGGPGHPGPHGRRALLDDASTAAKQCAQSWLGYQCTALPCGRIRIHWSVGGPPPPGAGGLACSYDPTVTQAGKPDRAAQLVHIAIQSDYTGWVGMSFAEKAGRMAKADAVIGFTNSSAAAGNDNTATPSVAAYGITTKSVSGVTLDPAVTLSNTGIDANSTALTVCFSRNISQTGAGAAINLANVLAANGTLAMNFVASNRPVLNGGHSNAENYQCGTYLDLWMDPGGPDDKLWRPSNISATAIDQEKVRAERQGYMRQHGALMFTGWVVLVPAGILAARHRWLFTGSRITGMWFQIHRAVQSVAALLILIGFIVPFTTFVARPDQQEAAEEDPLVEAHERLAITIMVVLGLHMVVAVLRPAPEHARRWIWNYVHWWTGRGVVALALVNVCIGITLWRQVTGGSGGEWIAPLVVFVLVWVGAAGVLEVKGRAHKAAEERPASYLSSSEMSAPVSYGASAGSGSGGGAGRYGRIP